jgi:hypothetical protein
MIDPAYEAIECVCNAEDTTAYLKIKHTRIVSTLRTIHKKVQIEKFLTEYLLSLMSGIKASALSVI